MKNTLLLTLLILFKFTAFTQTNLVPNPSFEKKKWCARYWGDFACADWWWATNSPDYFNKYCNIVPNMTIPSSTVIGYQDPISSIQNAYVGFLSGYGQDSSTGGIREILECKLKSNLIKGQKYFASFYIVRADSFQYSPGMGQTNNIGILFTNCTYHDDSIISNQSPNFNRAHIYTKNVIYDSVNWTHITGSFVADSNYQYLMFGNFFDNLHTLIIGPRRDTSTIDMLAYYLLDDICVSTDSLYAENYQWSPANDIEEINSFESLSIYPNPSQDFIHCEAPIESQISIYNSLGVLTLQFKSTTAHEDIDISNFPDGVYFVKASKEQKNLTQKFIKMNSN